MTNFEKSIKANELRKAGQYSDALKHYKELWEVSKDKYSGSGLIFCLRKLQDFGEAIKYAEEVYSLFPEFDWCKNEYIWCLIQGKLNNISLDSDINKIIEVANKILLAKPEEIALKYIVFKVLKAAFIQKNWTVLNDWIDKLDPQKLEGYGVQTTGWTDKERWFYYKVNVLINLNKNNEAIQVIVNDKKEFTKQIKFFERLKIKALINLGKDEQAEKEFSELIRHSSEWWLLKEYGELLLKLGREKDALLLYIRACGLPPMKLEMKVSLFSELGNLFMKLENKEYALAHYELSKSIREENKWGVEELNEKVKLLKKDGEQTFTIKELLSKCKFIWKEFNETKQELTQLNKKYKGIITSLYKDKPFCFIKVSDKESYFCFKKDLPRDSENGKLVEFELVNSFDKKKNKETLRATNFS